MKQFKHQFAWADTAFATAGALLLALNIEQSWIAYLLFTFANIFSLGFAYIGDSKTGKYIHVGIKQIVFILINMIGLWNWVISPLIS